LRITKKHTLHFVEFKPEGDGRASTTFDFRLLIPASKGLLPHNSIYVALINFLEVATIEQVNYIQFFISSLDAGSMKKKRPFG